MVFDHNMNPAYIDTPDRTLKWILGRIRHGWPIKGYTVRIEQANKFVIVPYEEYLGMNRSSEGKEL